MRPILSIILFSSIITGCSGTINSFYNREVIEDDLSPSLFGDSKIGTLAVTAQRRLIIANIEDSTFCAEPPPETVSVVTDAIAAALTAEMRNQEFNAELAANFSKHVNQIYNRSQAVQIFRDYGFYRCVEGLNSKPTMKASASQEKVSPSQEAEAKTEVAISDLNWAFSKSIELLKEEITPLYKLEEAKARIQSEQQAVVICEASATTTGGQVNAKEAEKGSVATGITCKPLNLRTTNSNTSNDKSEEEKTGKAEG